MGEWEQMTWGEIARKAPVELEHFTHRLDLWNVPGAETVLQVQRRMLEAVREIAAANVGKTVAAFSHGMAIRILLAEIQGYPPEQLAKTSHGDNTAVSLIEADGDVLRVIFRDDNSHLASMPADPKLKRRVGLEPGVYFLPTRLPEEQPFLSACVKSGWADSRPYDAEILLSEAETRPTMTAWLGEQPVGILQLNPEKESGQGRGWISLYCMIAGPSEILVLADGKSNPRWVAADLLSQAEHDKLATAVLVTDSPALARAVQAEVETQLEQLPRRDIARASIDGSGKIIVTDSMADPVEMARFYNDSGADELVFYDITASVEGRGLFTDILRRVASEIFIPLTVGGGINTVDDFDRVLKCGADKVSVNSGAIRNPALISEAAKKYGDQCVVLSM